MLATIRARPPTPGASPSSASSRPPAPSRRRGRLDGRRRTATRARDARPRALLVTPSSQSNPRRASSFSNACRRARADRRRPDRRVAGHDGLEPACQSRSPPAEPAATRRSERRGRDAGHPPGIGIDDPGVVCDLSSSRARSGASPPAAGLAAVDSSFAWRLQPARRPSRIGRRGMPPCGRERLDGEVRSAAGGSRGRHRRPRSCSIPRVRSSSPPATSLAIPQGAFPRLKGYFVCPAPEARYILAADPQ